VLNRCLAMLIYRSRSRWSRFFKLRRLVKGLGLGGKVLSQRLTLTRMSFMKNLLVRRATCSDVKKLTELRILLEVSMSPPFFHRNIQLGEGLQLPFKSIRI
jgi:hypothetical protein